MKSDEWYASVDAGIRFAVRVLHGAGVETIESCEGGEGHALPEPTIYMAADGAHSAAGFRALGALAIYGIAVRRVSLMWHIDDNMPCERRWKIVLRSPCHERAGERC